MATLSDILVSQAGRKSGDSAFTAAQQGVSTGIELATLGETIQGRRNQVELQKQQIAGAKLGRVEKFLDRITKSKTPAERGRVIKAFDPVMTELGFPMSQFTRDELQHNEAVIQNVKKASTDFFALAGQNPELATGLAEAMIDQFGPAESLSQIVRSLETRQKQAAALQITEAKAEVKAVKLDQTQKVKAQEDFRKRVKTDQGRLNSITTARDLLETGGPISQTAAQFMIAKSIQGAGVLTDKDISRLGGSKAFENRLNTLVKQAATGEISTADRQELTGIAELMETRIKQNFQKSANSFATARAKALGTDPASILDVLELPDIDPETEKRLTDEGREEAPAAGQQTQKVAGLIATALDNKVPPEQIQASLEKALGRKLNPNELSLLGGGQQNVADETVPTTPAALGRGGL